jgi:type IV secretion system protein VirB9
MRPRLPLALAAALLLGAPPARALGAPPAADPRIRSVDYDPQQVVRVAGVFRTATQIVFGAGESVLHAALGDSTGWEVVAEKNIVFIKPKARRAPTNLIVTTTLPAGRTRSYTFELVARAGPTRRDSPNTDFVVRFRYPQDARAAALAVVSAAEAALQRKVLDLKLERGVLEGPRNLAYEVQGAAALQPSEVSDNGRFTVMRFPAGQALPAVYAVTPQGAESLVPFDVRGEFVVIHATGARFRLRRGADLLCIYNLAPTPDGARPPTHTAAADVERTDKEARQP